MRIQTSIKHHGFLMPLAAIKENDWDFSIKRYKEIVYDAAKVILDRIKTLGNERNSLLENLKIG